MKSDFATYYASNGAIICGGYFLCSYIMAEGGQVDYKDILDMTREERIAFIKKALMEDSYYSEKRGSFDLISEQANDIIEKHFHINKNTPLVVHGDKIYFEPDNRTMKRDGYVVAQAKYAIHFITSTSGEIRIYDKQKANAVKDLMDAIRTPDERLKQKSGEIIYVKKIEDENYCCPVLRLEINRDGNLMLVTFMPEKKSGYIQKKKASGDWSDASFGHSAPKLPSGEITSSISGSVNDAGAYNKDSNNSESEPPKNMRNGGKIEDLIQIVENQGKIEMEYSIDESIEVSNAGDAIMYRLDGLAYEIVTWNKNAEKHRAGEKTIAIGEVR